MRTAALTDKEQEIYRLIDACGPITTRDISDAVFGFNKPPRLRLPLVSVHMSRLRKKIAAKGESIGVTQKGLDWAYFIAKELPPAVAAKAPKQPKVQPQRPNAVDRFACALKAGRAA